MTTQHEHEAGVDLFDFGRKLGPMGESLVREFIEDLGGEIIEGGAEERVVVVYGLTPECIADICRFDLQRRLSAFS